MCIRDSVEDVHSFVETRLEEEIGPLAGQGHLGRSRNEQSVTCLLYTSDAADERSSVDLGGRRIIKKKKKKNRRLETSYNYE